MQGPLGDRAAWAGDPRWDEYSYVGTGKVDKWWPKDLQYFVRKSSRFAQPLTDFLRTRIVDGWYVPVPFHIGTYSPADLDSASGIRRLISTIPTIWESFFCRK